MSLFSVPARTLLGLPRTRPPPILWHCQHLSQRSPHFPRQSKLSQPPLLRRHVAATPCTRYARPLKSDPEPSSKASEVSTQSHARPTLRENIYTIPNLLTVSRILACPALGWSIFHDDFYLATGLLVYAGLSDLVSNTLARVRPYQDGECPCME